MYVPSALTFINYTFCPRSVFMNNKQLYTSVFVMWMQCIFFEVGTEIVNTVANSPVTKWWLCKPWLLLGKTYKIQACNNGTVGLWHLPICCLEIGCITDMQPISKQQIGKHAYNNRGIVGNGVSYLVHAKLL
jgi:hypothetical protein